MDVGTSAACRSGDARMHESRRCESGASDARNQNVEFRREPRRGRDTGTLRCLRSHRPLNAVTSIIRHALSTESCASRDQIPGMDSPPCELYLASLCTVQATSLLAQVCIVVVSKFTGTHHQLAPPYFWLTRDAACFGVALQQSAACTLEASHVR